MGQKKQRSEETAFKNMINSNSVKLISDHIASHYPHFKKQRLLSCAQELGPLELKKRVQLIAAQLQESLPSSYLEALKIIQLALTEPKGNSSPLKGFNAWPLFEFIQTYGQNHPKESLRALKKMTPFFTAEFAIRPFIRLYPQLVYPELLKWTSDKNEHVRRLTSEGSRPRLPWGEVLKDAVNHPQNGLNILDQLMLDSEIYVQKSVANHLNDISKDHPQVALAFAKKWIKKADTTNNVLWILKHGLRTLIKKGDSDALKLFGFGTKPQLHKKTVRLTDPNIKIGDSLEFRIDLSSKKNERVLIDYAIHFLKQNGEHSKKVFKLSQKELIKGESLRIIKKHSFKLITTRSYYTGLHFIEVFVNGHSLGRQKFTLKS